MNEMHPLLSLFELKGFDNPQAGLYGQKWLKCEKCRACGGAIVEKSPQNAKVKIGAAGIRWPDVLCDLDGLILHERVCKILRREQLKGFRAHPVVITEIKSKKLASLSVPQYFLLDITGRVDIDPNQLDDVGGSLCPVCFRRNAQADNPYRWKEKRIVPELETWDGDDFVKIRNWRCEMNYCSKQFIDLANEHRWTNFIFGESLPGVAIYEKPPKGGVSYFDDDWFADVSKAVKAKHFDVFE